MTDRRFAENTSVSADKSRAEIERTLERYGADQFMYGWEEGGAMIAFRMKGRYVRMVLPLPPRDAPEFQQTPAGRRRRSADQQIAAWEQATRQSWRALALVVKAKLEAVAAGISSFEREFLADTLLPGGQTVSDWLEPQLEEAYEKGVMPKAMLALPMST